MLLLLTLLACGAPTDDTAAAACVRLVAYADFDGDGFGDPDDLISTCELPPDRSLVDDDCDDAQAGVHPGALEVCNGLDDDCDGQIDGLDASIGADQVTLWYADLDGDGWGDPSQRLLSCGGESEPWIQRGGDCDDADPAAHPDAPEICGGVDDDCDGLVDDDDPSVLLGDGRVVYRDADGDSAGDPLTATVACEAATGWVLDDTDCDDGDPDVALPSWTSDADGDGYGAGDDLGEGCDAPSAVAIHDDGGLDCADGDPARNPSALEVCGDGDDDDCDGVSARCGPVGEQSIDDWWITRRTGATSDEAGAALAFGDLDGDGVPDMAVGGPGHYVAGVLDVGAVWIVPGPVTGDAPLAGAVMLEAPITERGYGSILGAGDVSGDGQADLVVFDGPASTCMWVFHGPITASRTTADADTTLCENANHHDLVRIADFNDDGIPDLASDLSFDAAAAVLFGPDDTWSTWELADVRLEWPAAGSAESMVAHDHTGDGSPDLLSGETSWAIGALSNIGAVFLFEGPLAPAIRDVSSAERTWVGAADGDTIGALLEPMGDVDGDGSADLLVQGDTLDGWILPGGAPGGTLQDDSLATITGVYGATSAAPIDADEDGWIDLVLMDPDWHAVYLAYGPLAGTIDVDTDPDVAIFAGDPWELDVVAAAPDLDGDGAPELAVGGPGSDDVGADAGAVFLLSPAAWVW